jgi:hypothetical protein
MEQNGWLDLYRWQMSWNRALLGANPYRSVPLTMIQEDECSRSACRLEKGGIHNHLHRSTETNAAQTG